MGFLQFLVTGGVKTQLVTMQESAGVDELYRKVCKIVADTVKPEDIRLVFEDYTLEYNQKKSLKDYNLVNLCTLTLHPRMHMYGKTCDEDKVHRASQEQIQEKPLETLAPSSGGMALIEFNVSIADKTRQIHISETAGVDELFEMVAAKCTDGIAPDDIRLVFGDVQLEYKQNKRFEDYSLAHMSTITLLLQLHGGANSSSTQLPIPATLPMIPKQRAVQLMEIPTWIESYEKDRKKLVEILLSKDEAQKQEIEKVKSEYKIDPTINSKVSFFEGDITSLQVDAIVSANNEYLRAGGGVSLRIKAAAGQKLEIATNQLNGCKLGEAKTTEGFDLPAKYVVHTAGPQEVEPKLLESCYRSCLEEMKKKSMKLLAFPCIATGFNGYPSDKAVLVALKTVRVWLEEQNKKQKLDEIDRIIFCLFTPDDIALYRTWMQVFYPVIRELLPLPGFIEITTTEPDMLGLDDESPALAKMPCGHVIGPISMTDYCRDLLKKGRFRFYCPSTRPKLCNREWEYFLVRHVARLTPEELQVFEKKISDNYLNRAKGMQKCPGCQVWCLRAPGTGCCVRCQMCTKANGKFYDFCWWCLNTWKAAGANRPCGNAGCDGRDRRLNTLETCKIKKVNNITDCPSIRGCPKCGILIEHRDKCGHMDCANCGDYGFCFICLREKKDGKWQCSPWMGTCVLAPRQTILPGSR